MNKIKKYLLNLWYGLPFAMKGGDEALFANPHCGVAGTQISQEVSDQRVAKHLLKGEVTQEVEELRYRTYKVSGEADKYNYLGNGVAMKDNDKVTTTIEGKYKFSQDNGLLVTSVLDELNRVNDYGIEKYRLEIMYNSIVRFKVEQFVTQIDVNIDIREKTKPKVIETTLHFEKQPDPYNPKSKPFINELSKVKNVKTSYEIERNEITSSIFNLSFTTYKATNEKDLTNYSFTEGAKFKTFEETEHEYLLTFEWDSFIRLPLDLEAKYYSKTMNDKYQRKEKKDAAPEMVNSERKAYCSVCGREMSVYDADIQRADGQEPVCKFCMEKALKKSRK